jgi:outer membrane lipoprotein LolB
MTRYAGAALLWLSLASVLVGCAHFSKPVIQAPDAAWDSRRLEITQLEHWLLQARVASGRVGWSGNMRWRQDADEFDIRVSGPLGTSGFMARGNADRVEIRTAKETVVTEDPQALLQEKAGWGMPFHQLRYWAVGVPYPHSPALVQIDANGRLLKLEQDGWRLEYSEYRQYQQYELPRRFSLENSDMYFRVIVDDWSEFS